MELKCPHCGVIITFDIVLQEHEGVRVPTVVNVKITASYESISTTLDGARNFKALLSIVYANIDNRTLVLIASNREKRKEFFIKTIGHSDLVRRNLLKIWRSRKDMHWHQVFDMPKDRTKFDEEARELDFDIKTLTDMKGQL